MVRILFIVAIYAFFMLKIEYATDQEWSRYLLFNSILWAALVGFLVGDFLNVS
jgi:hypothetical protein